jgi:hypothetical protein
MDNASKVKSLKHPESQPDGSRNGHSKKDYSAPRLVEYGTLAKLTRAKLSGATDSSMSACL